MIENCDIIHCEWDNSKQIDIGFINAMNAMSGSSTDSAIVENFTIRNIHFDTPVLRFLDIRSNQKWEGQGNISQGWHYRNFAFDNIHLCLKNDASDNKLLKISDDDPIHKTENFNFKNIFIDNKLVSNTSALKKYGDPAVVKKAIIQ